MIFYRTYSALGSPMDKKAWMSCILLGFGIKIHQLIVQLPWLSFCSHMALARLALHIHHQDLCDPPPNNPNLLINWTASQLRAGAMEAFNRFSMCVHLITDEGYTRSRIISCFKNIDLKKKTPCILMDKFSPFYIFCLGKIQCWILSSRSPRIKVFFPSSLRIM